MKKLFSPKLDFVLAAVRIILWDKRKGNWDRFFSFPCDLIHICMISYFDILTCPEHKFWSKASWNYIDCTKLQWLHLSPTAVSKPTPSCWNWHPLFKKVAWLSELSNVTLKISLCCCLSMVSPNVTHMYMFICYKGFSTDRSEIFISSIINCKNFVTIWMPWKTR